MFPNIEDLSEGGRGIKLMWQIADELSYTRTSTHQNCLLIGKNYQRSGISPPSTPQKKSFLHRLFKDVLHFNWFNLPVEPPIDKGSVLQTSRLRVNTDLSALATILLWFDQLNPQEMPKEVGFMCKLALAEGFTNAVRYAHNFLPPETPIDLEIKVFESRIEMRIWDFGKPFDLEEKLREFRTLQELNSDLSSSSVNFQQNGHKPVKGFQF